MKFTPLFSTRFSFSLVLSLVAGFSFASSVSAGENKDTAPESQRSVVWVEQAGGLKHDKIRGITVDAEGNCYVTGEFTDEAQFGDRSIKSRGGMDFVLAKYSPEGKLIWLQTAGGSKIDRGYAVSVDKAGNSYVTGHFQSPTFQIGDFTFENQGDYDYFIAKYDPTGKLLWAQTAGGAGYDYGHGIAVTPEGDCYVSGSFAGQVTLGNAKSTHKQGRSLFVAKYDTEGKLVWSKLADNGRAQSGHNIAVDQTGNCYVCGYITGQLEFAGKTVGTDSKVKDIFLAKFSPSGELIWAADAGGESNGLNTGVVVDGQGNCYVTGMYQGVAKFGQSEFKSVGAYDIFVARINADGSPGWAYTGGGEKIDYGLGIASDKAGNCYVTGEFTNDVKFMGQHLTGLGGRDLFAAKFSPDGTLGWLEVLGGKKSDLSYAIAVDQKKNCYLSGAFSPETKYQSHELKSYGSNDIFLMKLSQ